MFVFPTAGEPSDTAPLPMYNSWLSIAQPSSPLANCGNPVPVFFCPLRICIRDICTTATIISCAYSVFMFRRDICPQACWSISTIQDHRQLHSYLELC